MLLHRDHIDASMSDQEASQRLTLPFGDVIKRVAFAMYSQLQNVLHNMRIQSPELRTQSLISFISRSKKKLAQLLAITRWLDMPGISQFFANMSQLRLKISARENRLNENQDALYFTHSQLFCCRIRTLDVVSAKDILARGIYPHLPASIFSHGTSTEDDSDEGGITSGSFLRKSLNIFLRSKLVLRDCVPSDIDQSSIINGLLTVRVNNIYELILTLDYLDTDAPWNILKYRILVSSHPRESFNSRQDLSRVENDILLVLRRIAAPLIPTPIATTDSVTQIALVATKKDGLETVSDNVADVLSNEIAPADNSLMPPPSVVDASIVHTRSSTAVPVLPRLHVICQHAANAAALRYLYIQALETSRSVLTGLGEAEFQEKISYSQFIFRFWRSRITGYYQYELRVIQLRSPVQIYSPLEIEVVVVDSYGKEIGGDVGLAADSRNFSRNNTSAATGIDSININNSDFNNSNSSNNNSNINSSSRSGSGGHSDDDDSPKLLSTPYQAPKLIVELWTLSAPDDSDGSSRITRRRIREKATATATASSEEVSQSAALDTDTKVFEQTESLFDVSEFIAHGVTFGGMFHRIIEMSSANKLSVLYNRFLRTPSIMSYFSTGQVRGGCSVNMKLSFDSSTKLILCLRTAIAIAHDIVHTFTPPIQSDNIN